MRWAKWPNDLQNGHLVGSSFDECCWFWERREVVMADNRVVVHARLCAKLQRTLDEAAELQKASASIRRQSEKLVLEAQVAREEYHALCKILPIRANVGT